MKLKLRFNNNQTTASAQVFAKYILNYSELLQLKTH